MFAPELKSHSRSDLKPQQPYGGTHLNLIRKYIENSRCILVDWSIMVKDPGHATSARIPYQSGQCDKPMAIKRDKRFQTLNKSRECCC